MSELDNNVFSDVDRLFGNEKSTNINGINVGSLLGSAANTLKAKCVNTGAGFGSLLGSSNFDINDDDEVSLPFSLSISLNKKWVDSKIIKIQVKVSARKSFALDINLLAVKRKLVTAKTQLIRKIFSTINGFERATTSSKFEKIIQLMFTSEKNLIKTTSLAKKKRIIVNSNLKKQGICSD
ncbi:hypothetical protein G9A89_020602 [Geosiphon pyriformis]|nr:hypothetical protein G9A89_020602 [Geosiphon pyriformis]